MIFDIALLIVIMLFYTLFWYKITNHEDLLHKLHDRILHLEQNQENKSYKI